MAITSESQLIDIATIQSGCVAYAQALEYFIQAGQEIIDAGTICDAKALSVDDSSMQPVLYEVGQMIQELSNTYSTYVTDVYSEAVTIYNQQVTELNAYYQRLAEEQAKNNNK